MKNRRRGPDPPAEVQALIDRNAYCNSLATHPKPISAAQLDAQRLYFKCDAITKDVALLRKRYQNDPRILEALELAELPADADDHRRMGCDELAAALHAHPDRAAGSKLRASISNVTLLRRMSRAPPEIRWQPGYPKIA